MVTEGKNNLICYLLLINFATIMDLINSILETGLDIENRRTNGLHGELTFSLGIMFYLLTQLFLRVLSILHVQLVGCTMFFLQCAFSSPFMCVTFDSLCAIIYLHYLLIFI